MPLNPLLQKNRPLIHPIIPGQPSVVGTALPAAANSPRAVPALRIPASVYISASLGGIGLGLVNAITGLHVVVDPYVNMNTGDEIRVFFNNVQVHIDTVAIPNIAVDLRIPYGAFTPGTDQTVSIHYTVTRVAGTVEASVPRLYRIKLTRPGGVDPSADPQHQNLRAPVLPPHIVANGVSEADAQAGFKATIRPYPDMASYDVIDLRWNGVALPLRTVLPSEVGGNIDIDITAAVIAQGGDGRDLMVFYRVYDQVNNVSEDSVGQPWSMITLVYVHANPNALPVPEVPGAPNDVLRLEQLGANDVHVHVYPYPPVFVRGDRVTVRWDGQTSTGQPEVFEQTLTVGNVPGLMIFTVPNAKAVALGGGHVDVSYLLQDAGGITPAKPSKYLRLDVIGEAVGEPWPAPLVRDATGALVTTLNPIKPNTSNEENTATLMVTDARLKVGNVLAGLWRVANAPVLYVPWVTVTTDGQVQAPVPREFIAAALGKQVEVEYVVFRDGGGEAIGTSVPMTLTVLAIADGALPKPTILTVAGSNLDLNTLPGNATVHIAAWPLIAQGQRMWLRLHSTDDQNELGSTEWILGEAVTAAEETAGVSRVVPRAVLLKLQNGAAVNLEFKVGLGGGLSEGAATVFPVGSYVMINVVLDLKVPTVAHHVDGFVDPELVPASGLQVTVDYTVMAANQRVAVIVTGPNGQADELPAQTVAGQTPLQFVVPKELLEGYLKKTLSIAYTVELVAGALKQTSEVLVFGYGRAELTGEVISHTDFGPVDYRGGWTIGHITGYQQTPPSFIQCYTRGDVRKDFPGFVAGSTYVFEIRVRVVGPSVCRVTFFSSTIYLPVGEWKTYRLYKSFADQDEGHRRISLYTSTGGNGTLLQIDYITVTSIS